MNATDAIELNAASGLFKAGDDISIFCGDKKRQTRAENRTTDAKHSSAPRPTKTSTGNRLIKTGHPEDDREPRKRIFHDTTMKNHTLRRSASTIPQPTPQSQVSENLPVNALLAIETQVWSKRMELIEEEFEKRQALKNDEFKRERRRQLLIWFIIATGVVIEGVRPFLH